MEEKKYDTIVKQYRGILAIISRYLMIFVALVIAFFIFKNIFLDPIYMNEREDPFVLKKIELIGKFDNMMKQVKNLTDIQAQIIQ